MNYFRVTKYNPHDRNEQGHYLAEDWTSVSDVGGVYNGRKLDLEDYLKVENFYVEAVLRFFKHFEARYVQVVDLENEFLEDSGANKCDLLPIDISFLKNLSWISIDEAGLCARAILRELIWCKLEYKNRAFVHFGYDYYMYFGCAVEIDINLVVPDGLYVEKFRSPYL
ncbi:hypothetical protein [Sulfidibacter corallicola]|uniref:Uncharacterized protein n=1 Tax=Sulfidibacter corallicola TaxID=2818388 RepID=A0A8A4TKS0_SULCO|nr:hypothetical protein [Sulfidibacter corallicola]QTD50173.1 hypothetical protein J3U87_31700 [Sulfidibacter corallicola]